MRFCKPPFAGASGGYTGSPPAGDSSSPPGGRTAGHLRAAAMYALNMLGHRAYQKEDEAVYVAWGRERGTGGVLRWMRFRAAGVFFSGELPPEVRKRKRKKKCRDLQSDLLIS